MVEELGKKQYCLYFEGFDIYVKVYFNGVLVLEVNNMFCSWKINIMDKLLSGKNYLCVVFIVLGEVLQEIIVVFFYVLNKMVVNDMGELCMVNFVCKVQFYFGWDWGLWLVIQGIWCFVWLESWIDVCLEDIQFYQEDFQICFVQMCLCVKFDC